MTDENLEKKALLGMHHEVVAEAYVDSLELDGYKVKVVKTEQEMLEEAKREKYQVYIMDANLGYPGSEDITPCVRFYELVKERVEIGKAKFVAISGNPIAIQAAKKQGIPAIDNLSLVSSLSEFLG
jgi:hypothetical protein